MIGLGKAMGLFTAIALAQAGTSVGQRFEVMSFGAPMTGMTRLHIAADAPPGLGDALSYQEVDAGGLAGLPDRSGTTRLVYQAMGPHVLTGRDADAEAALLSKGSGKPKRYYLFAQLSPGMGHDAEFNAFYDSTHLPDVLKVPGMVWGVRGKLASASPGTTAPTYLALYEFRSFDLNATIAEVNRRLKDGTTRAFPQDAVGAPAFAFYAVSAAE